MKMRNAEGAIAEAVEAGRLNGVESLKDWQRTFFLIAEAELLCDMGADFADDYAAEFLADGFAAAFRNIGAAKIADLFVDLAADMGNSENEQALAAAVSNRLGYDYRTVADYVSRCVDRPSERNDDALTHRMLHKRCPVYFIAGRSYISAKSPLL